MCHFHGGRGLIRDNVSCLLSSVGQAYGGRLAGQAVLGAKSSLSGAWHAARYIIGVPSITPSEAVLGIDD